MTEREDTERMDTERMDVGPRETNPPSGGPGDAEPAGAHPAGAHPAGAHPAGGHPAGDVGHQETAPVPGSVERDQTAVYPTGRPAGGYGEPVPGGYGEPVPGGYGEPAGRYPGPGDGTVPPGETTPDYSSRPVAVRRPDVLAGVLLLLAGVAAAVSLLLPWLDGNGATGLDLVRRGIDDLRVGIREPFDTGLWQPLAVVLGGAVLFVLGLLLYVPARRHRLLGVLAFLVAGFAAAAVIVPIWRADWGFGPFDLGFWFAIAVGALGLLGALKALFTGRRYR